MNTIKVGNLVKLSIPLGFSYIYGIVVGKSFTEKEFYYVLVLNEIKVYNIENITIIQ